ncbi:MAG: hypothetical protein H0V73_07540 [Chloroflexi bacterium]|nr:hypothetical protein [Chloroflexota bacterium]
MNLAKLKPFAVSLLVLALAACGSGSTSAGPSESAPPATYGEFSTAFCGAFTSLIRAVGNPDAGTPSVMSKALDDAVKAHDAVAADRAAAAMIAELEAGRVQAAAAARWQPGSVAMAHMDRLLVAFEALTTAKRAVAGGASVDPQAAFEQAGGVAAWAGTLQGAASLPVPSGVSPSPCKAFSGSI